MTHYGSCLCSAVEYEVTGPLAPVILCHCSLCRKATGSAFAAISPIAAADFHITKGEEFLRSYSMEGGVQRIFCSQCGSPIISKRDSTPNIVRLRIGSLNTPLDVPISAHAFVGSKAAWYDINDEIPQYEERP
ncbi:MAG: GFA family protein [Thiotrichaceae bacterium]|nr:GFA family protein [Thiotrichaceae bacterium]